MGQRIRRESRRFFESDHGQADHKDYSCQGRDDLRGALAAAVDAWNADVGQ